MKTFYENAILRLGLSTENIGEKITIFGFVGLQIEGHKGLLDYTSDCVIVRISGKKLKIEGEKLIVNEVTSDEMFVKGKIRCIEVIDA